MIGFGSEPEMQHQPWGAHTPSPRTIPYGDVIDYTFNTPGDSSNMVSEFYQTGGGNIISVTDHRAEMEAKAAQKALALAASNAEVEAVVDKRSDELVTV